MLVKVRVHMQGDLMRQVDRKRVEQALYDLSLAQNIVDTGLEPVVEGDWCHTLEHNLGEKLVLLKTVSPVIDFVSLRH